MKVSYVEGLATHIGPESCVNIVRKGEGEALTGVRAGWVLSREIHAPPQGGFVFLKSANYYYMLYLAMA